MKKVKRTVAVTMIYEIEAKNADAMKDAIRHLGREPVYHSSYAVSHSYQRVAIEKPKAIRRKSLQQ